MESVAYKIVKTGKANLKHIDYHNNNGLILAIRYKMENVVNEMLKYEESLLSDILHIDSHGDSSLLVAIDNLLEHVAISLIKCNKLVINHINSHGFSALILAITKGLENVALEILNKSSECSISEYSHIQHINDNGDTAFIYSITHKMENIAHKIYESGMSNPTHINKHGDNAFIYSIINEYGDLALKLFLNGDSNYKVITNDCNSTLMLALNNEMYKLAELIINDNDKNVISHINNEGDSAFILCITYGREDFAIKILKSGYSNYDIISRQNDTTLLLAINNRMFELAKEIILLKNEKVLNHINNEGDNALLLSIAANNEELALLLIDSGICIIDIPNNNGSTPLKLAEHNKLKKVVKTIKDKMFINFINMNKKKV
jgi:ankyrin repeat protein